MKDIVLTGNFLARELLGVDLAVQIVDTTNKFGACYGNGQLDLTSVPWDRLV